MVLVLLVEAAVEVVVMKSSTHLEQMTISLYLMRTL